MQPLRWHLNFPFSNLQRKMLIPPACCSKLISTSCLDALPHGPSITGLPKMPGADALGQSSQQGLHYPQGPPPSLWGAVICQIRVAICLFWWTQGFASPPRTVCLPSLAATCQTHFEATEASCVGVAGPGPAQGYALL